jgi:hypothetical protein
VPDDGEAIEAEHAHERRELGEKIQNLRRHSGRS